MSNEFSETTANSRQKITTWLAITTWLCLLLVFIAFCIIYATIDKIDLKGNSETKNLPLELLFDSAFITGLAALPVGFVCGLVALLLERRVEKWALVLISTLILGLLLLALAISQYQASQWSSRVAPTVHVIE
jgi:TRAP-type C4-dicarboxylate transport system permease small subunit